MKTLIKSILIILCSALILFIIYWLVIRTIVARSDFNSTTESLLTGDYSEGFYYVNSYGEILDYLHTSEAGYLLLQKSSIEVLDYDFHWNSKDAEVTVEIQYPDLASSLQDKFNSAESLFTSEELSEIMLETLNGTDLQQTTDTFQITLVQNGWHWFIIENDSLLNVYCGNLISKLSA